MTKNPDITGLGGGGHLDCYVTLQSPRKHKGQRIQILISDSERSNFPKLATQSERIVFRVRAGAIQKDTEYLYESEVSNAFTPDRLSKDMVCVSELDKYTNLPKGPLPQLPSELPGKGAASMYLVFIDEEGNLIKAIPTLKTSPAVDKASRQYIENADFKPGKKNKKPTTYYNIVVIHFIKE